MAYNTLSPRPYVSSKGVKYELQYDSGKGLVRLIEQNAPTGTTPVYYDGKWNPNATSSGFNAVQQQTIHNDIQTSIRKAFTSAGGTSKGNKLPIWAAPSQKGNPPGQSTVVPSQPTNQNAANPANIGAAIGAILNPDETFSKLGRNYGVDNSYRLFSQPMKYPIDLKTNSQDTLVITAYEYVPPTGASLLTGTIESIIQTGLFRGVDRLENPIGTVFFPMPNGVAEGKDVTWGPDTLNTLNAGVMNDVMKNTGGYLAAAGLGAALGGVASKLLNPTGGVGNILGGVASGAGKGLQTGVLARALGAATGSEEGRGLGAAALMDRVLNASGFAVPAETILSRTAGLVPNDNLELLFGGPSLRSFSISYRLTARSRREAEEIRKIIRFFKQTMSPRKRKGYAGQQSVFLSTPNVYKLKFTTNGNAEIQGVSKFKTCALTSFQTDYTPDGQWMAYDGGQPISTRITMAFTELEPIYDTDYQQNVISGRVNNLSQISDDSVGY